MSREFSQCDLVLTNFFGGETQVGLVMEVRRSSYGIQSYLTFLSDGRLLYLQSTDIISPEELAQSHA
jgi:hypothetical protein